jgi:hypothetical protein
MQLRFWLLACSLNGMDVITMLTVLPGCLGFALLLEWGALKIIVTVLQPQAQVVPKIFRNETKIL